MLTKKQGNYAILSKTFCVQKECVFAKPPFLMDSGLQKKMGNGACWWAIVCALGTGKYFSLSCGVVDDTFVSARADSKGERNFSVWSSTWRKQNS